jgi:hypothetical protein
MITCTGSLASCCLCVIAEISVQPCEQCAENDHTVLPLSAFLNLELTEESLRNFKFLIDNSGEDSG